MAINIAFRPEVQNSERQALELFGDRLLPAANSTSLEWRAMTDSRGDRYMELWRRWPPEVRLASIAAVELPLLLDDPELFWQIQRGLIHQVIQTSSASPTE